MFVYDLFVIGYQFVWSWEIYSRYIVDEVSAHQCSSFRCFKTYTGRYTCHCWDHVLCYPFLYRISYLPILSFYYSHSCPMPQMQEYFVKKNDRVEVVCMIGVYGLLVSSIQLYPFLFGHMITRTNMYIRLCMELKFQLLVNLFQFSFGDNFMEYHTGESQCNLTKNAAFILNILLDRCWSLRVWN